MFEPWVQGTLAGRLSQLSKSYPKFREVSDVLWDEVAWDIPKELAGERKKSRVVMKALEAVESARAEEHDREDILTLHKDIDFARKAGENDANSLKKSFKSVVEGWVDMGNEKESALVLAGHAHVGSSASFEGVDCWTLGQFTESLIFTAIDSASIVFAGKGLNGEARRGAHPVLQQRQVLRYAVVEDSDSGAARYVARAAILKGDTVVGGTVLKLHSMDDAMFSGDNCYLAEEWGCLDVAP